MEVGKISASIGWIWFLFFFVGHEEHICKALFFSPYISDTIRGSEASEFINQ